MSSPLPPPWGQFLTWVQQQRLPPAPAAATKLARKVRQRKAAQKNREGLAIAAIVLLGAIYIERKYFRRR